MSTSRKNAVQPKQKYVNTFIFLCFHLFPFAAFAFGGDTPVSEAGSYITNAMYGATGITLATLSFMVVGLLCLGHYLKWVTLLYTVVGIGFIFGAPSLVDGLVSLIH